MILERLTAELGLLKQTAEAVLKDDDIAKTNDDDDNDDEEKDGDEEEGGDGTFIVDPDENWIFLLIFGDGNILLKVAGGRKRNLLLVWIGLRRFGLASLRSSQAEHINQNLYSRRCRVLCRYVLCLCEFRIGPQMPRDSIRESSSMIGCDICNCKTLSQIRQTQESSGSWTGLSSRHSRWWNP